ncbi:MAG TPA: hypothetical protein VHZ02_10410 [Acidimicrobiales bacterium]|nr:hypothetical protein [Acidimicrobiales bacterium]
MSPRRPEGLGLLGWYPPRWRERYGDELGALMEDALGDGPPTPRFRLGIALAGLRERGHEAGVIGDSRPAPDRARAGSLLVLCAWAAFVVAGSSFAKLSEGFGQAVPARTASLPSAAYDAVMATAIIGGLAVLAGVVIAVPAFLRFLKAGGWPSIRGHVGRASIATLVAAADTVALVAVAHTLTPAQRNGQLVHHPVVWYYLIGVIVTALLLTVMVGLWTVAAVATVRRLDLPRPVQSGEALLATAVAATMCVMTAATAAWWGAIASSAPWFLQGGRPGSGGSPINAQLAGTMVLMVATSLLAGFGASRVARSWRQLHFGPT